MPSAESLSPGRAEELGYQDACFSLSFVELKQGRYAEPPSIVEIIGCLLEPSLATPVIHVHFPVYF